MPTATAPWSSRTASPTRSTTPPSCWLGARKSCSTPPSDRASRSPICPGRSRKRMRFIELGSSQERPTGAAQTPKKPARRGEEPRRQEPTDQGKARLGGSQQGEAGRQEACFCRQEDRCERQEGAGSGEKPRRCQEIGSRYGEISTEGQETGR